MKKRRWIFIAIFVFILSFEMSACDAAPVTPHNHSYVDVWSNDTTYHWHSPKCNDTNEVKDKAQHTYANNVCTICGYERPISHKHSWYTEWSSDETYHWHSPKCDDTNEVKDKAQHTYVNNVCTACGYERPNSHEHEHSWYTEWSSDETYHWHSPKCNDTNEVKDKAKHNYVDYVCTACGYNRIPDASSLPQTDFEDVGEKFKSVVAPLYNVAKAIFQDLVSSGDVNLRNEHNPRIIGIRYTGNSFWITIREDIYINKSGEKSEFLQQERNIALNNFGEPNDATYSAYKNFLRAERKSQSLANYEEFILPYAERSAELISAQYETYKDNKEIIILNMGKQLVLSAKSSLSEAYNKIIANLNSALAKKHYPLITNQDLAIGFGGNLSWEIAIRWIIIEVDIGNLRYCFYISFNENGEFSKEFINYYEGTNQTGYTPSNPDLLNPPNEEYSALFERLEIEQFDLSDIQDSYKYDGNGCALYNPAGEDTILYF